MPLLSVLQLDTHFPRIAGDVASPDTYACGLEILRVNAAHVPDIVTARPTDILLAPFADALSTAKGDLITTSCGFLAPFQDRLQALTPKPFIASALSQLPQIAKTRSPAETAILTFDADKLNAQHLPPDLADYTTSIIGLNPEIHLRRVIEEDRAWLDTDRAARELADIAFPATVKTLLLECTNLPPYKPYIKVGRSIDVFDILTAIEAQLPGVIQPQFL